MPAPGQEQPNYCTFAVTDAFPLMVNRQVRVLLPLLEHAPDQTASRPFVALSVTAVPDGKDAAASG